MRPGSPLAKVAPRMWTLERYLLLKVFGRTPGGEIMWYSTVRLRHFGSGRYLACDSTSARDEQENAAVSLCTKLVYRSESTGETSARTVSDESAYGNTTDDATIDAHKMAAAEDVGEKISSAAAQDGTHFIIVPPESRAITVESTNDAVPLVLDLCCACVARKAHGS